MYIIVGELVNPIHNLKLAQLIYIYTRSNKTALLSNLGGCQVVKS